MPEINNHENGRNTSPNNTRNQFHSHESSPSPTSIPPKNNDVNSEINQIRDEFDIPSINKNEQYINKENDVVQINGGGFIDSHQTRYEMYGPNYRTSFSDQISNQACVLKLKLSGVKDSQEFYQTLHQRGFNNDILSRKEIINNLKKLSSEEIANGLDRINKLGFDIDKNFDLSRQEISNYFKEISAIPADKFNNFTSELNQYFFLNNRKFNDFSTQLSDYHFKEQGSEDYINPFFKVLLKNAQKSQLEPEIKNRLDLIKEIALLNDHPSQIKHANYLEIRRDGYSELPKLVEIFDPSKQFKFNLPKEIDQTILKRNFNFIYQNINSFNRDSKLIIFKNLSSEEIAKIPDHNGKMTFLKQLSEKMEDEDSLKATIDYVTIYGDPIKSNFNDVNQRSSFLFELISQPIIDDRQEYIKVGFIMAITENLDSDLINSLPDKKDQNFWNLIKDLKHYSLFEPLLSGDQEYLDENNLPTEKFFEKIAPLGGIRCLLADKYLANLPVESQYFWSTYSTFSKENQKILIDIKSSLKNYSPSPDQSNEVFYSDISNKLITVSNEIINKDNNVRLIFSFINEDILNNFKPDDKKFWNFIKTDGLAASVEIQKILLSNREKFNDFFDQNNNPTVKFYETCLKSNILLNIPENIFSSFSTEDQNFLSAISSIKNVDLITSLIKNRSSFESDNLDFFLNSLKTKNIDQSGAIFGEIMQLTYRNLDKRYSATVGLCGWRVFNDYLTNNNKQNQDLELNDFNNILGTAKNEIDKKLHYIQNTELDIPKGLRVSIGTELEVMLNGLSRTGKITKEEIIEYTRSKENLNKRPSAFVESYVKDITEKINDARYKYKNEVKLIDNLGVGKGRDAVHEFANNATKNYSVLLWELYEISRLGFIDFDRKLLQNIERGMHLTISGDTTGIKLDENAHLLQNALLGSGWSTDALDAAGSAEVVGVVDYESQKIYKQIKGYILERNSLKNKVFEDAHRNKGVENRAIRVDSFNHLARTLQNFYHLAIPLKAYQNFVEDRGKNEEEKLLSEINVKLDQGYNLHQLINESNNLLSSLEDEKVKKAIISWAYFRESTVKVFDEKQKNLSRYKLKSPLSQYNDMDMTRLGSELFEVFGGVSDEGLKLDDALRNYHEKAETDSLPDIERKLISEVKKEVKKIFKPNH